MLMRYWKLSPKSVLADSRPHVFGPRLRKMLHTVATTLLCRAKRLLGKINLDSIVRIFVLGVSAAAELQAYAEARGPHKVNAQGFH